MARNLTQPDKLVVTQEDREAAAGMAEVLHGQDGISRTPERFRSGELDEGAAVQAFAAHRQRAMNQAADERQEMCAKEIADLRQSVIAFLAPWAAQYAQDFELPKGHLHPTHYDLLAKAGARMDNFTRAVIRSIGKGGM